MADKGNNIVILNISDHISKLSKILEDTSKFKRANIEEGKTLNNLIIMKEQIIHLLKSLENQHEIFEKKRFLNLLLVEFSQILKVLLQIYTNVG